jgi:predicted NBD/HSP70 family sugar kinase
MHDVAIGIDIGGTNLRAARVSAAGEILDRVSEKITRDPNALLTRIIELIESLDRDGVTTVGIGVPGRVDARRRLALSGGYVDLSKIALGDRIKGASRKSVVIDNDCNMALIAEIAVGAARGRENVAMLTIGTGIGGAIVQEGRIVRGKMSAGQLGHVTVDVHGRRCLCGRHGCVETTSSGTALGRHLAEAGLALDTTIDKLFALDAAGDKAARAVLLAWAGPLRAAIDSIIAVVDPELVLLGGGLGVAAHRALVVVTVAQSDWYQCELATAELGDDAGVIGAALSSLIEPLSSMDVRSPERTSGL